MQCEEFFPEEQYPGLASQLKDAFNIILPLGFIPMMFCTASGFAGYVSIRQHTSAYVYVLYRLWLRGESVYVCTEREIVCI
jgi:hypothetical protein